jgi:putative acetyltransferase
MRIRRERAADVAAVRRVNEAAFATTLEANLVDRLREDAKPIISVVADEDGLVVGHILFSPVTLSSDSGTLVMGLAPMAVLPDWQRRRIGSSLVHAGLDECRLKGAVAVVVLGHPTYYPRFGFKPASTFGITSEYEVPDDAFMAIELMPGALEGKGGVVRYHAAFRETS